MAKPSVAGTPLSSNDILELADLFEISLQYYCKHNSPLENDYILNLSKIVGLGFTAILVDSTFIHTYEPYLKEFFSIKDFKRIPYQLRKLSAAAANIINGSVYAFRFLRYPDFYLPFEKAVKKAITHIAISDKSKEAEKILEMLF